MEIFRPLPTDDVNEILGSLPLDQQEKILALIQDVDGAEHVMQYQEKTAGHIMTTHFFALPENTTAADATAEIRQLADVEMVFYVYVIDKQNGLKGVISLRQLVTTAPTTPLRELISAQTYTVHINTPQEEVAQVVSRYNIMAVPVVDQLRRLVGIVTVDDVIDVIREENTEDMLKMSGAGEIDLTSRSILKNTRARLPWLFASFIGGILAAYIIGNFETQLKRAAALAAFIPIIMGMGGNIGTQSSTIVVRGLATGGINLKETWQVLWRELVNGTSIGLTYGLMLSLFARLPFWDFSTEEAS